MSDADSTNLQFERHADGESCVLTVYGEIDVHSSTELEREVRDVLGEDPFRHLVLDVAGVGFIDSSGLRTLIALEREAHDKGRSFALRAASRPVVRLLEVTGLSDQFEMLEA